MTGVLVVNFPQGKHSGQEYFFLLTIQKKHFILYNIIQY